MKLTGEVRGWRETLMNRRAEEENSDEELFVLGPKIQDLEEGLDFSLMFLIDLM